MGGQSDSRAAGMRRRSSCQQSTLLAVDTYLRALPPSVHTLKQQVLRDVYLTSQDGQERTASSITGPRLSVFTRNMKVQGGMSDSAHTKGQAPGTKTMAAASIRAAMKVASLNGSSATPLVDGEEEEKPISRSGSSACISHAPSLEHEASAGTPLPPAPAQASQHPLSALHTLPNFQMATNNTRSGSASSALSSTRNAKPGLGISITSTVAKPATDSFATRFLQGLSSDGGLGLAASTPSVSAHNSACSACDERNTSDGSVRYTGLSSTSSMRGGMTEKQAAQVAAVMRRKSLVASGGIMQDARHLHGRFNARKSGLGSLDDLAGKGGMLGLNAAMVKGLHHQEYSAWIGDKVPSQKALRAVMRAEIRDVEAADWKSPSSKTQGGRALVSKPRAVSSRTGGARHESSAAYAASAASRAEAARIAARVQKQATMPTPKAAVYAEGAYFPC